MRARPSVLRQFAQMSTRKSGIGRSSSSNRSRRCCSSTGSCSGPGPRPCSIGLQRMPKFEMEKMEGWRPGVHQLAASDCEPLLLRELLALADDDSLARWEALSLGYPCNSFGELSTARFPDAWTKSSPWVVQRLARACVAYGLLSLACTLHWHSGGGRQSNMGWPWMAARRARSVD